MSNFYKWTWRPALKRAGLPESITPHSLRHGTASLLRNQNVPVPIVSRYLGARQFMRNHEDIRSRHRWYVGYGR